MKKLFIAAAALTIIISANAQGLTKGQKINISSKMSMTMSVEAMGQSMEIPMEVNSKIVATVDELTGNTASVKSKFSNIKLSSTMMGQETKFDSDNKDDMQDDKFKPLAELLAKEQAYSIDVTTGKQEDVKVKGADESTDMMKNMAGPALVMPKVFLPITAKKVGDKWEDVSENGKSKNTYSYEVTAVDGGVVTVKCSGVNIVETTIQSQMGEMAVSTKGKTSQVYKVDQATGKVKSLTSTVENSGELNAGGMNMPSSTKITYECTID